ncbi:MAG: RNA 2',3'-cyclic phosphodiesterase [Planctomycetaceae bacterium]|nr:RNA 2',3'-cyclic phosphodiesterase [Planctomycetaceae bacterium]
MPETARTFIAVPIPATPGLRKLHQQLKEFDAPVRTVDLDGLHLTLRFLGETPWKTIPMIGEILGSVLRRYRQFSASLTGLGAFPDVRRPRVVWVGVKPREPLTEIANQLTNELRDLGFPGDRLKFVPHVTLARIKGRPPRELPSFLQEHESKDFGEFLIDRVVHYQSELTKRGPVYTVLTQVRPMG